MARLVGWADTILAGTGGAPWIWWIMALIVILALLFAGLKILGLWPE